MMTMQNPTFRSKAIQLLITSSLVVFYSIATAQEAPIKTSKLSDSIYLLSGKGGNIGVSIGKDGTFLIDDKFAPMTQSILDSIKTIGGNTPKFVFNTHWHADHTGGNENLGKQGSIIVAHDNVRKRLSVDNFIAAFNKKVPAYPAQALPQITFANDIKFHLNDDGIEVLHMPNGHTDGDSIVHFTTDNILHSGDLFFNGFYPFIDIAHGGSLNGTLKAAEKMLSMVDDKTKIIPGHGPLASKVDLTRYRDMLAYAYEKLSALKSSGKTAEQAIAAKPLAELDDKWSGGIFKTDKWIGIIYAGLD
jgi:glyoxylase-like metal-dependent hydrolase (beta-lactamase superfamily II)